MHGGVFTSGSGLAGVDVADNDDVDMSLLLTAGEGTVSLDAIKIDDGLAGGLMDDGGDAIISSLLSSSFKKVVGLTPCLRFVIIDYESGVLLLFEVKANLEMGSQSLDAALMIEDGDLLHRVIA